MGMLASIGIIKGSDFDPDPRMVTLLSSAVKDAYDYMQWYLETPGKALVPFWGPASQWQRANIPKEQITSGFPFVTEDRLLIEERGAGVYFWATFIPKKLGGGSFYLMGLRDKDGNLFDGVSLYRLTVPHDTPAGDFWSVVAYDMETKSFFREVKQVGISSLDKDQLKVNHDGSIDIFFGPEAQTGGDANWIPTPGRFMLIFRLYGPEKRFFERTWQLPDVEKIE